MANLPDNVIKDRRDLEHKAVDLEIKFSSDLGEYCAYLEKRESPLSRIAYLRDLKMFFEYMIQPGQCFEGKTDINQVKWSDIGNLTHKDVNHYLSAITRGYIIKGDKEKEVDDKIINAISHRSAQRKRTALLNFIKYAERNEYLDHPVSQRIDSIKNPIHSQEVKHFEDDQIKSLFHVLTTGSGLTPRQKAMWEKTKKRDLAIINLFLASGLRETELRQLNLSSFDWDHHVYRVIRKRGKDTIMTTNAQIEKSIKDYIENERPDPKEGDADAKEALFLAINGSRISVKAIFKLVKKYTAIVLHTTEKNGYSPHKLRATAATQILRKGMDLHEAKEYLDHEDISTTQLYVTAARDTKEKISQKMDYSSYIEDD